MCALKRKIPTFQIYFLPFWKQLKFQLNLLSTRMAKRKKEERGSLSKSEEVNLNRVYSWGRAAYAPVRNFSKTCGLSKKKVEQFYKPRHRIQKPNQTFPKIFGFCGQTSETKQWSQKPTNCCWCFFKICQSSNNENKLFQKHFASFQKNVFSKKHTWKILGWWRNKLWGNF